MNLSNMPNHNDIKNFGQILSDNTSYNLIMEKADSRVVLLSKNSNPARFDK